MNIREQWSNLSIREKQSVALGLFALIIFCFYEMIWSPFASKVDSLRLQVEQNRDLLAWMQKADKQLSSASPSAGKKLNASMLSTVQAEIKKSPFVNHVSQLRQAENDTVQLNLQKVDFDGLMKWLTGLWNTAGLKVQQISVTPTGAVGEVNVDLVVM